MLYINLMHNDAGHFCQIVVSSMQGWRVAMEDAHTILPVLPRDPEAAFFAVFDGHGGAQAAKVLRENLAKEILHRREYAEGKVTDALRNAFIDFDKKMMSTRVLANDIVGSTAVTLLIKNNTLYCANLGDSRAVASIRGHAAALSFDHKPSKPKERKRIEAAGSFVFEDRVNGSLAIARCFGDFALKRRSGVPAELQPVSCYPDISIKEITDDNRNPWDILKQEPNNMTQFLKWQKEAIITMWSSPPSREDLPV